MVYFVKTFSLSLKNIQQSSKIFFEYSITLTSIYCQSLSSAICQYSNWQIYVSVSLSYTFEALTRSLAYSSRRKALARSLACSFWRKALTLSLAYSTDTQLGVKQWHSAWHTALTLSLACTIDTQLGVQLQHSAWRTSLTLSLVQLTPSMAYYYRLNIAILIVEH